MNSWYRMQAQGESATIRIFDEIGMWGVTAEDFSRDLDSLRAADLTVEINSPGGEVFDGLAIHNALRAWSHGTVTTHVVGVAASIASVIALAGDTVKAAKHTFFMIHNPFTMAAGDAREFRRMAETLEKISAQITDIYESNSTLSASDVADLMDAETWFTALEAQEVGFVDVVDASEESEEDDRAAAHASNIFDLSDFRNTPKDLQVIDKASRIRRLESGLREVGFSRPAAKYAARQMSLPRSQREAGAISAQREADAISKLAAKVRAAR